MPLRILPAARWSAATLALALALGAIAAGFAAPASAEEGDTALIVSGPSSDGVKFDNRTSYLYLIDPGQHVEDVLLVRNDGKVAQEITVFASDGFNTEDGSYAVLQSQEQPTGMGTWVSLDGSSERLVFTLAPTERRAIQIDVSAPRNAAPGDHAGGIVVSTSSAAGQVTVERRVVTRMYVRVDGDLRSGMSVPGMTVSWDGPWYNPFTGQTELQATIENTGNVVLTGRIASGVTGLFGVQLGGIVVKDLPDLLPGNVRVFSFVTPDVGQAGPIWPYLTIVPSSRGELPAVTGAAPFTQDVFAIATPWWVIAIAVIAAIWIGISLLLRERNRRAAIAWVAWTEAEAQRRAADAALVAPSGER